MSTALCASLCASTSARQALCASRPTLAAQLTNEPCRLPGGARGLVRRQKDNVRARRTCDAHPSRNLLDTPQCEEKLQSCQGTKSGDSRASSHSTVEVTLQEYDDRSMEHATCVRHRFWHFELRRWRQRRGGASSVTHPAWCDVGANSPVLQLRR